MTTKYKVMSKAGAGVWDTAYFETLESAREYAAVRYHNHYCNVVVLYVHTTRGYKLSRVYIESWKQAAERWARDISETAHFFL